MPQKKRHKNPKVATPKNVTKIRKLGKISTLCAVDHLPVAALKPGAVERVAPPKRQPETKKSTSLFINSLATQNSNLKPKNIPPLYINSLATHPASEASELRLPLAELDGDRVKAGGDPLHLLLPLPQLLDRRSQPSLKSLRLQPIKPSFLAQSLIWLIVI